MNTRLFFLLIFLLIGMSARGQLSLGVTGGINTTGIQPEELLIKDLEGIKHFGVAVKDADYGMHFGLYTQLQIKRFVLRPEVLFSSDKVNYKVTDFSQGQVVSTILSEKYRNIDLPVLAGYKWGALRLMGGPVGHVFVNSKSELSDLEGFEAKFKEMTYGYQLGLGLDAWRLSLDFRYEGDFQHAGDHFTFFGKEFEYSSRPSRFLVSIAYKL